MKIIIFGKTKQIADDKLDDILEDIPSILIKKKFKNNSEYRVVLDNNITYITLKASEMARGHRCDLVYIDRNIDVDIIKKVIFPLTTFSSLLEDIRIQYY